MMPEPDSLRDFAARYTAAWCSQDAASVAAFYSPGGSLTINDGSPSAGRGAIAEAAQSFMTAFPDLQVLMDGIVAKEDLAEYRWTLTGTHAGRKVRISGFEVWKLGADGLIAESRGHFDSDEYRRQLDGEV
jgi:hypothetical protein